MVALRITDIDVSIPPNMRNAKARDLVDEDGNWTNDWLLAIIFVSCYQFLPLKCFI